MILRKTFFWFLMVLAAALGGSKAVLDHAIKYAVHTGVTRTAPFAIVEYDDTSVSLPGHASVTGVRISLPEARPIRIDKITLYDSYRFYSLFYDPKTFPARIRIDFAGIRLPVDGTTSQVPPLATALGYAPYYISSKELNALGYGQIVVEMRVEIDANAARQDGKQQDANKKQVRIDVDAHSPQLGRAVLAARLKSDLPAALKSPTDAPLLDLSLAYSSEKFLPRVFAHLARRNNTQTDTFKARLATKMENDIRRPGISPESVNALKRFIKTPETLKLTLHPNPPFSVNALLFLPPETLPRRLGLKISLLHGIPP